MEINAPELKALNEAMEKSFKSIQDNIKQVQDKAETALEEVRKEGTLHAKTNEALTKLGETGTKLADEFKSAKDQILAIEQKLAKRMGGMGSEQPKSIGQIITESEQFKAAQAAGASKMEAVNIGSFHKTAILNATLNNDQPLVQAHRVPGILMPGLQPLTMRSIIPAAKADSNYIEYVKENVFTNAAAPQGGGSSPVETEGQAKAESAITFTLAGVGVITLAHWIPASRQVLSDASMLQSYVESRLLYGLKQEEDDEILNGDGTSGTLTGLVSSATAYNRGATNDSQIDSILKAFLQVTLSYYEPTAAVLNPIDWTKIQLLKDTQGRYLFSDPHTVQAPSIWGKPVVATTALTAGDFLVGAFNLAAQIWDREDATVRVAEQHSDFFIRNMVAILAEERLALTIYRAAALVKGTLGNSA